MGRLFVVEEAFRAGSRGCLLAPRFVAEPSLPRSFQVRLKAPRGAERTARAELQVAHMRGPLAPFAMIRLPDLAPEDIPAGTEVWTDP
jgi:hypothetical protein